MNSKLKLRINLPHCSQNLTSNQYKTENIKIKKRGKIFQIKNLGEFAAIKLNL